MATAMPTANSPLTACWTLSRRSSRSRNTRTAAASAAQIPVRSPSIELATMNAIVGKVASSIPRQPPSCSSTRCRSNVSVAGAGSAGREPTAGSGLECGFGWALDCGFGWGLGGGGGGGGRRSAHPALSSYQGL